MKQSKGIGKNGRGCVCSKALGGLGFWDLAAFNQAFLAKKGWCTIQQPELLRSLAWGNKLSEEGCMWKIGSSESIGVMTNNWLFGKIGCGFYNDPCVPMFAEDGMYSVKQGYILAMQRKDLAGTSDNSWIQSWWRKFLWSLNILPKIKMFVWRTCHNWLLVKLNLGNRGIDIDPFCFKCGACPETICHSLRKCMSVKHYWKGCSYYKKIKHLNGGDPMDWFQIISKRLSKDNFVHFVMVSWELWNARNRLLFGKPTPTS
ncbi:uncharacterized protein LOC133778951 [Humulus lupulus]|uniref:uncharacterized protein LOC133778951 n=1 Tax=Humulus lupulus TaxID=3486 RepID=UPI002B40ADB8|nr:uncharacterized protein LOC133778951 [Humulus lupulus]